MCYRSCSCSSNNRNISRNNMNSSRHLCCDISSCINRIISNNITPQCTRIYCCSSYCYDTCCINIVSTCCSWICKTCIFWKGDWICSYESYYWWDFIEIIDSDFKEFFKDSSSSIICFYTDFINIFCFIIKYSVRLQRISSNSEIYIIWLRIHGTTHRVCMRITSIWISTGESSNSCSTRFIFINKIITESNICWSRIYFYLDLLFATFTITVTITYLYYHFVDIIPIKVKYRVWSCYKAQIPTLIEIKKCLVCSSNK